MVYTYRLHVDDMFDEMAIMAKRDMVKVLFNLLFSHHFFLFFFLTDHKL